ncbi:TetR family transcriptional regulator [Rhodococcoides trifolii]|uniref:TetR family transcriptional regulator n=1 Tax=Rhodococcoides trifolii TaxID=908250 RepID=A0A917G4Z9_9NOCA|nr:TetR family transcriptional regulator [Rhodococcus trifolii]
MITAAADLLLAGGYDAVRHRSVAARASLPLASTTYYFDSLDDLVARAVELNGARELEIVRNRLCTITPRARGAEATVELMVDLVVGPDTDDSRRDLLIARYERFIASARHPELRTIQRQLRTDMETLLVDALDRAGRCISRAGARKMLAMVDGVILGALGDVDSDPRERVREVLLGLVDHEAPLLQP